ncbi:MAG TPA: type II toxin-antitoxin system VapC family toxin [Vicinamibacteria bacterium]|jgi:predicted nucleic acid-binding protein
MRILVDTSAYSAFLRGHPTVKDIIQLADSLYLNPIVLGELHAGFQRGGKKKRNEELLARFLESPRVSSVPIDDGTATRYAVILNDLWKAGTPIAANDLWIAATAMQHGLSVLTTDGDFLKVKQVLVHHIDLESAS